MGFPQKAVAHQLGLSYFTIKRISQDTYQRLEVSCLADAMAVVGWVKLPKQSKARKTASVTCPACKVDLVRNGFDRRFRLWLDMEPYWVCPDCKHEWPRAGR